MIRDLKVSEEIDTGAENPIVIVCDQNLWFSPAEGWSAAPSDWALSPDRGCRWGVFAALRYYDTGIQ